MTKKNLTASLKKNTREMSTEEQRVSPNLPAEKEVSVSLSENQHSISKEKKKKVGRPKVKTEPEKTINIAVPISLLEKMNIAKVRYQNNMTKYVNEVLKKDFEERQEEYLKAYEFMNS